MLLGPLRCPANEQYRSQTRTVASNWYNSSRDQSNPDHCYMTA